MEGIVSWVVRHQSRLLRLSWLLVLIVPIEWARVHVSSGVRMSSNRQSDIHDAFSVIFNPLHDWLKDHEVTLQFFAALPLLFHYICHLVLLVIFFHLDMWIGFEFLFGQLGTITFQSIMGFPLPSTAIRYSEKFWYLMETPGMDVGVNWHFFVGFLAARHAVAYYNIRAIKVMFVVHAIMMASLTMSCRTTYTLSCLLAFVMYGATLWAKSVADGFLRRNNLEIGKTDEVNRKELADKQKLRQDEAVLATQRQRSEDGPVEVGFARGVGDDDDEEEEEEEERKRSDEVEMDDVGDLLTMSEEKSDLHQV